MIFVFKSAVTLALLYCCFFAFLSKETFHRFNRIMLVGIMVAALVIPSMRLTTTAPTLINEGLYEIEMDLQPTATPIDMITEGELLLGWTDYLLIIYVIVTAAMAMTTLAGLLSLLRYMRGGLRHTDNRGNTIILKTGNVPPFSIHKYIVMSVNDYETSREYILAHEQEHIRLGHTYDLLLLEAMKILQWFNPFIWFLSRDLKAIHEFEADQAVINRGFNAKEYQQLLIKKATNGRMQPLINNLNHYSLKRRIIMMYHKKSSRWMQLKALCAVPVAALAITAFARPQVIETVETAIGTAEYKITKSVKETVHQVPLLAKNTASEPKSDVAKDKKAMVTQETGDTTDTLAEAEQPHTAEPTAIPTYETMPEHTGRRDRYNGVTIKRNKENTYVTLTATCTSNEQWFKIGGKENQTFIENVETGDHYKLRRIKDEGIVLGGDGFIVRGMEGKTWAVTLEFPPLPKKVRYIRFWHMDSWTKSGNRIIKIKDIEEL